MFKNEMESYVRIGVRGLKNLTYTYIGMWGGGKNSHNHPYVINEWPQIFRASGSVNTTLRTKACQPTADLMSTCLQTENKFT